MKAHIGRKAAGRAFLTAACAAALALGSCKKDGSGSGGSSAEKFLTASTWKIAATQWRAVGGGWVAPPSWAASPYPSTMTFFGTKAYTTSSGSSGTWQLSSDSGQLTLFRSSGGSSTADIAALTGSTLQLSTDLDSKSTYTIEGSGTSQKYTYYDAERTTFSH
jgi:hypothetical protein